jgi:hypothetical protein
MIQGFSSGLLGNRELIYETDLPSFQRDFASLKTLNHGTGPNITFTRASGATYFDADGVLQTAANDTPRFDHDPATGASRGLLIEEARTNLLVRSAELDNAAWSKTRATITADATTAPDGTSAADKLVEDSTASNTHRAGSPDYSAVSGTTYTLSVFLKAEERTHAQLSLHITNAGNAFTTLPAIFVDLATGTISSPSATVTNSSIASAGNGWWRVSLSALATSSATQSAGIYLMSDAATTTYTGDGTSGLYIWGAQLEAGAFPTSYIPTTTAAATRSADSAVVTPISSFYNQAEGTLFAEGSSNDSTSGRFPILAQLSTDANNRISLSRQVGTNNGRLSVINASVAQATSDIGSWAIGTVAKLIASYKQDDFAATINGAAVTTDTSGTVPSAVNLRVGVSDGGTSLLNGHIRKLAYWPKRLTNTLLGQLTT